MTDEQEKILNIRVNYQEAVRGIAAYKAKIDEAKKAQEDLNGQMERGEISADEYADGMATTSNAIKVYEGNIRTLNREIQNNIKEQQAQEGSLTQMRAQLSNLTKAYDNLSASERENGSRGKELRDSINEVTTKLKEAEEATQRYQRNVGNYENAIKNTLGTQKQWFTQLQSLASLLQGGVANAAKTVATAVQSVGKQFLVLLANPIVAIIAAIAAVFMTLQKALKSNEEGTRALQRVLAPFQALLNGIINVLQTVAQAFITLVEGLENAVMAVSRFMEKLPLVGSLIKSVNDRIAENVELVRQQQALEDAERESLILTAREQLKVAKLRELAEKTSDPRVRAAAMKKAIKIEEDALQREKDIAKQRVEIAVREAAQTKNSKEQNDKLAQAKADWLNVETNYVNGMLRLRKKLRTSEEAIDKEQEEAQKKRTEAAKKAQEERIKNEKEAAKKEQDAIRMADDAMIALIKDQYERQRAQTEASYDRKIADLKKRLAEEKNLTETAIAEINTTIVLLAQQRANALADLEKKSASERLKQAIDDEQKRLQLIIDTSKKGSKEQYEARMQMLQQQQDAATAEIEMSELTEQQKAERLLLIAKKYDQERTALRIEQNNAEIEVAQESFNQQLAQAIDNEVEKTRLLMEQKQQTLLALHQMEGESNDAFRARELAAEKAYTEARKKYNEQQMKSEIAKAEVVRNVTEGLSKIMDAFGEENKTAAIASKMLALAQIAISTGVAIAEGVAQAQSVPFPANIAAIATTVGTIMGNIATAISTVKSAKFADGGLVEGPGTGTSDSIPARLSNGESVMTAQSTAMFSPLLSALNQLGGGIPINSPNTVYTSPSADGNNGMEMLSEAFKSAVREMPNPVVAVSEINKVQERVDVIENLATV